MKLAYAQFGDLEKDWISLRVGRQLINYDNTMIADSEWRNQARSYDAAVVNLHYRRVRLGVFAASAVVPLAEGISHHQEGNNIHGLYGSIDQPAAVKTGKQDEHAYGIRFKGMTPGTLAYSAEAILERGSDETNGDLGVGRDPRRTTASAWPISSDGRTSSLSAPG